MVNSLPLSLNVLNNRLQKEALVELSVLGKVFAEVGQNEDRVIGKYEIIVDRK